jgi:predicted nucleic acid-binding protein
LTFVLDASVTLAWCFDDDQTGYSESVLRRLETESAIVPSIWPLEVINPLLVAERSKQFDLARTMTFVTVLVKLPISVAAEDPADVFTSVLALAREQGISSYDASYLRLAQTKGLALASVDGGMQSACERLGVAMFS